MILGIGRRILVKVLCNLFPNYDFISPYPMQLLSIKLEGVSKCTPSLFYAQSPDFHKLGLCYYLKILYL